MKTGQWYLHYMYPRHLYMEKEMDRHIDVLLQATTEEEAIKEARAKWDAMMARLQTRWDARKKQRRGPNIIFDAGEPIKPYVIYKIPL